MAMVMAFHAKVNGVEISPLATKNKKMGNSSLINNRHYKDTTAVNPTFPILLSSYLFFLILNAIGGGVLLHFRALGFFRIVLLLYLSNFVILPVFYGLLAFWKLLNARTLRRKIPLESLITLGISVLLLSIFVYASVIEPGNIQIEHIEISSSKIPHEIRILHITDIQSASIGRYEGRVFSLMNDLQPDLIVHTGDLLQPYFFKDLKNEQEKLSSLFKTLSPRYGIFNVVGDVDWRLKGSQFEAQAGITTLSGQSYTIRDSGIRLDLLGLSLRQSRTGAQNFIEEWQQTGNSNTFRILFGHAPDYILTAKDLNIDLSLAGHTHGGQIRIPFLGPLVTLSRIPREWAMGYRKINDIHFNVSSGIGAEHASQLPPIRFNCPPTMTLFTLRPSQ